jgi:hypothetical protein
LRGPGRSERYQRLDGHPDDGQHLKACGATKEIWGRRCGGSGHKNEEFYYGELRMTGSHLQERLQGVSSEGTTPSPTGAGVAFGRGVC